MRIALISEHASPLAGLGDRYAGGQNAHVAALARSLARLDHPVRVYTRWESADTPPVVRTPDGVEVVHVPAGPPEPVPRDDLLPFMGEFGRFLAADWHRTGTPDVVHAHFWMSGLAAVRAARRWRLPVVQTYHALGTVKRRHQGPADTSPPGRIRLERMLGRTVRHVLAQCADERTELLAMGVPEARIRVVPSGVDVDRFTPDGPAAPRSPHRARILAVGRLVPRKGFDDLIRALPLLPNAEAVIVGGPPAERLDADPEARRLRQVAAECGVADRVVLVGAVPQERMPDFYRSADVLACTPWYEPFGLTPLEAMSCGVPVVACATGGLTDTVVDGVTGALVPAGDRGALVDALDKLLSDPALRARYGAAGRMRACTGYAWTQTAAAVAGVYREAARQDADDRAWTVVA